MKKKLVATIILNRNLPKVTNQLYENLKKNNKKFSDFYILEAGSDSNKLSKYYTWYANWPEAKKNGLRFARGMNFALWNLLKENKLRNYEYFFLITNDTVFKQFNIISILLELLKKHPKIAILSPCSKTWGEYKILGKNNTKYFWFIHNNALFIKRQFIEDVMNLKKPYYLNFLFDGNNFRGYGLESELIAKAYSNNWAAAITSNVIVDENESYLLNQADLIKTESYDENIKLYITEGTKWMREKYGFKSKWALQMYVKNFYDKFFEYNPELIKYKI